MRSPSPWSILVHPPGRASESPERPASATITHDGWPGGFQTDRPHADRPMRADPQPADRSVRPAFVGVPKIAHIIRADRPDGSRIPFDPDLCIEHPLPGDEHRRRLLYRCPAEARPGDRDGDGDLWIYRELLWGMSVRNNRPYRPQETSGDCRFVTREEAREMFRDAGKEIPPELADDAAGLPADFGPTAPSAARRACSIRPNARPSTDSTPLVVDGTNSSFECPGPGQGPLGSCGEKVKAR